MDDIVPMVPSPPEQEEEFNSHILRGAIQHKKKPAAARVSEVSLRREWPYRSHTIAQRAGKRAADHAMMRVFIFNSTNSARW
jgi:hypothetical protein